MERETMQNSGESFKLKKIDRRKFPRVPTRNVVSYLSIDENGNTLSHGMGKAMDISQSGIRLETSQKIESGYIILEFVDLEDKLVNVKGKVAYCMSCDQKVFNIGISFEGTHEENIAIAAKLLRMYHTRKNNLPN
jgi:hypothetical protein